MTPVDPHLTGISHILAWTPPLYGGVSSTHLAEVEVSLIRIVIEMMD